MVRNNRVSTKKQGTPSLYYPQKNQSIIDPNVRSEAQKLFEENIGVNLCHLVLSKVLLDMTLKMQEKKITGIHQNFKLCISEIRKEKDDPQNREKFANYI